MKILHLIRRLGEMIFSDGEEKKKLSLENILYMLFAGALAFAVVKIYQHRYVGTPSCDDFAKWAGCWLGIFICAVAALWCFVLGVVSQAVLFVSTLIGLLLSKEKKDNLIAFLVCLLSIAALAVGGWFVYSKFLL